MNDKDFFDWLKTKQDNNKLTQTQVDVSLIIMR